MNQNVNVWYGERQILTQLKIVPFRLNLQEPFRKVLESHGATVIEHDDHWLIRFPPVTVWAEELPRIMSDRHKITFLDGFFARVVMPRTGQYYIMTLSEEGLPEEVLKLL